MFSLLKNMIKEEWRIHSTLMGNLNFLMLPMIIFLFGFVSSFFGSIFREVFSTETLIAVPHISFLFFGMAIGGFGISGQEFMNRRFGQISLLSYSSRSLPIKERKIFLFTVIKDVIYYFMIWIFPLVLGFFLLGSFLFSPNFVLFMLSLLSLSISFLLGASLVFFLSMLYANSSILFLLIFAIFVSLSFVFQSLRQFLIDFLIPLNSLIEGNYLNIIYMIIIILLFTIFSILFVRFDFKQDVSIYKNEYPKISKRFSFTSYRVFLSKDYLDLRRSRGGLGKIFFSYLIPVIFIYYFVDFFRLNVIDTSFIIMFSILLGVFSASIYTWITEHDLFAQYMFLPVKKSDLMKSKISTFWALNMISYFVIISLSLFVNELNYLFPSLLIFSIVSLYSLSLTIYLTGLLPSIRFMNAKILLVYMLMIVPVMLSLILVYEFFTIFIIPLLLFVGLISYVMLKKSFPKWDSSADQSY